MIQIHQHLMNIVPSLSNQVIINNKKRFIWLDGMSRNAVLTIEKKPYKDQHLPPCEEKIRLWGEF